MIHLKQSHENAGNITRTYAIYLYLMNINLMLMSKQKPYIDDKQ